MENTQDQRRARATRAQLEILEAAFAINSHPNLKVREELGTKLGMTERSVQIWFQNKRAKTKASLRKRALFLREEALKRRYFKSHPTVNTFTCDALTIGTWQRIHTPSTPLICGFNVATSSMSWTLGHLSSNFNISFSFDNIQSIQFNPIDQANAKISFYLKSSPLFAVSNYDAWIPCPSFIPTDQGSSTHTLLGNAADLRMQLFTLLQHCPLLTMRTTINPSPANPYSSPLSESSNLAPYPYQPTPFYLDQIRI
ncbi:hypothetical protein DSO57_1015615 [Entomophthora muscae]|uniref:Uncharacterized protein n=1 Tax=Entomophthora muscae TaxID=34485 RepID=A0ACC2T508_9FUNG|nr:hypothetical protein DSO57_1015615 [Entomophthora muscae]